MRKTNWITRLVAFGASAAVTLTLVTALADYGLPADGAQMLAHAGPAAVVPAVR